MVSKVPQNILERGQKKVQKKKEEKASMAIEKWMGDAAIAGANSTKGLLPSSLTVTYLAVAPRHTSLLRRSSLLVVLQHKKEEAFIGWMSSAALMAVEQKKARNGRGPLQPLQLTRATMSRLAAKWLSAAAWQQRQYIVVVSATKAKKRCFFAPPAAAYSLATRPPSQMAEAPLLVCTYYYSIEVETRSREVAEACVSQAAAAQRRRWQRPVPALRQCEKETLALSCGPVKKAASKAETGWPKIPPLSWPTLHAFLLRAQYIHICRGADGLRGCYS